MLVSEALAQAPAAAPAGGGQGDFLLSLAPLILIFIVFYFLLIRPQQKKMKQHKEMISSIRRGDRVTTSGGLIGKVSKIIDENYMKLEIAEGVQVTVVRAAVSEVMAKAEPGGKDSEDDKDDGEVRLPNVKA